MMTKTKSGLQQTMEPTKVAVIATIALAGLIFNVLKDEKRAVSTRWESLLPAGSFGSFRTWLEANCACGYLWIQEEC